MRYNLARTELRFGDGIMSAINFRLDVNRVPDPAGDRVVVTLNGKLLPYPCECSAEELSNPAREVLSIV